MGSGCCSSFQQGEDDEGIRASGIQGEAEQTGPVLCGEGFLMICVNGRREQKKREKRPLLSGAPWQYQWPQTKTHENSSEHKKALPL